MDALVVDGCGGVIEGLFCVICATRRESPVSSDSPTRAKDDASRYARWWTI
jgi:hypothetical protein